MKIVLDEKERVRTYRGVEFRPGVPVEVPRAWLPQETAWCLRHGWREAPAAGAPKPKDVPTSAAVPPPSAPAEVPEPVASAPAESAAAAPPPHVGSEAATEDAAAVRLVEQTRAPRGGRAGRR